MKLSEVSPPFEGRLPKIAILAILGRRQIAAEALTSVKGGGG